ncbi:TPA: hypothetical protein ACH3X1_015954 [Trebouxia sp. C0004]
MSVDDNHRLLKSTSTTNCGSAFGVRALCGWQQLKTDCLTWIGSQIRFPKDSIRLTCRAWYKAWMIEVLLHNRLQAARELLHSHFDLLMILTCHAVYLMLPSIPLYFLAAGVSQSSQSLSNRE